MGHIQNSNAAEKTLWMDSTACMSHQSWFILYHCLLCCLAKAEFNTCPRTHSGIISQGHQSTTWWQFANFGTLFPGGSRHVSCLEKCLSWVQICLHCLPCFRKHHHLWTYRMLYLLSQCTTEILLLHKNCSKGFKSMEFTDLTKYLISWRQVNNGYSWKSNGINFWKLLQCQLRENTTKLHCCPVGCNISFDSSRNTWCSFSHRQNTKVSEPRAGNKSGSFHNWIY